MDYIHFVSFSFYFIVSYIHQLKLLFVLNLIKIDKVNIYFKKLDYIDRHQCYLRVRLFTVLLFCILVTWMSMCDVVEFSDQYVIKHLLRHYQLWPCIKDRFHRTGLSVRRQRFSELTLIALFLTNWRFYQNVLSH